MQEQDILIVETEIIPNGMGGWLLRCHNTETGEERICKSIEEYNAYLNECAFNTAKSDFKVEWLESPKATPAMIADVRKQLMDHYKKLEEMG